MALPPPQHGRLLRRPARPPKRGGAARRASEHPHGGPACWCSPPRSMLRRQWCGPADGLRRPHRCGPRPPTNTVTSATRSAARWRSATSPSPAARSTSASTSSCRSRHWMTSRATLRPPRVHRAEQEDRLPIAGVRFVHDHEPFPVDVFPSLHERYRETERRRVRHRFGREGRVLPFLSAEDLCVFKLSYGQPQGLGGPRGSGGRRSRPGPRLRRGAARRPPWGDDVPGGGRPLPTHHAAAGSSDRVRGHDHARNGDVEIYYETFGDPADPTLVLVNGLGSQCIN